MGLLTVRRGVVGLILLTGLVYASALGGTFIWDDEYLYIDNPRILNETLKSAFTRDHFAFLGVKDRYYHYRPIAILAHSWMARAFNRQPFFLHMASLVMHAVAGVFIFFLILELWGEIKAAWVTAALFLVHPLHAEPVAWMASFGEVLAGAFFFLSLYGLVRSERGPKWWLAVSYLAAALAFLSKETALALPLVAVILVGWRAWPYFAVAGSTLLMRYLALGFAAAPHANKTVWERITITLAAACHFTKKLLWPWPMAPEYDIRYPSAIAWGAFVVFWALAAWLAYRYLRPRLAVWFLVIPLSPALALSSYLPPFHEAQDRNAYVAVLGFVLLIGCLARHRAGLAASLALVVLWSGLTVAAVLPWREQESLWTHTLQVTPNSKAAVSNLAYWYFMTHRFAEADRVYERGLYYRPNDKDFLISRQRLQKVLHPER